MLRAFLFYVGQRHHELVKVFGPPDDSGRALVLLRIYVESGRVTFTQDADDYVYEHELVQHVASGHVMELA